MGTLVRNSDGFTIHFDVGAMAGTRMTPLRQDTTAFFRTHVINDNFAYTGIERRDGRQTVATTICDWCERSRRFVEESDAIRLLPEEQREEKYRELNERRSQFDDLNKGLPMIANFWADVTRDEDLAEFLIIVNSYKLKPR